MSNRQSILDELKELYNSELITSDIKRKAWEKRGICGNQFRNVVKGISSRGKAVCVDNIAKCLTALKEAISEDLELRTEKFQSIING